MYAIRTVMYELDEIVQPLVKKTYSPSLPSIPTPTDVPNPDHPATVADRIVAEFGIPHAAFTPGMLK